MIKPLVDHIRALSRNQIAKPKSKFAILSIFVAVVFLLSATNLQSASASTIRSANTDGCTVDVGTPANASIAKNSSYCVTTITGNTTVTIPSTVTSLGIIVVGGGGGGFADGGSGGSGGETRYSAAQAVTANGTATVSIGAGGSGGVWGGAATTAGGSTSVTGAGLSYTAAGGAIGSGWGNSVGPSGGTGGSGGTGLPGGAAGGGPGGNCNPVNWGGTGSNGGYVSTVNGVSATYFGGGGGGGMGAQINNSSSYYGLGTAPGSGGGRGANLHYALDDATWINGASAGHNATYYGGGGGGGSACDAHGSGVGNGVTQRTNGGNGYQGVVILSWIENTLSVAQAADGCLADVASACLQGATIQLKDSTGTSNLSTAGVSIAITATSAGTLAGTLTATTNSSGLATFNAFYITGSTAGTSVTLTFESVGYRNIQSTITLKRYAANITVTSSATDASGSWFNNSWITAQNGVSNINATDLATAINSATRTLRASGYISVSSAVSATTSGNGLWLASGGYTNISAAISTTNGPVTVLANADAGTGASAGNIVLLSGGSVTTTGGAITFAGGIDYTTTTGYARGYNTADGATTLASGATYNASTYAANTDNAGIWIAGSLNSGGGAIKLNGQLGSGTADSAGFYQTVGASISSAAGSITIKGLIDTDQTSTLRSYMPCVSATRRQSMLQRLLLLRVQSISLLPPQLRIPLRMALCLRAPQSAL